MDRASDFELDGRTEHPFHGENPVYPLDGVDPNLSTESIISILSTPFAPALHHKQTTNPTGLAARVF
ncbi:MAG: hypothetical protein HQ574_05235 [Chloroflexi bacterium]|nr:hypothetical protein [Chloroflexota bacterium]